MGCDGTYKGGCGELDVIELVGGDPNNLMQSTSIDSHRRTRIASSSLTRPVQPANIAIAR